MALRICIAYKTLVKAVSTHMVVPVTLLCSNSLRSHTLINRAAGRMHIKKVIREPL
jgi:hypothetical protein